VRRTPCGDAGAAVVDFVLVGSLLTLCFLAVLQVAVDYYVRNVLESAVADGARYGANADVASPQAGADRANELIRSSLGRAFAHATPADDVASVAGAPVVGVTVSARLPLLAWFLPVGPTVTVTGHALAEPRG
jgi:Flp pilus assembly protein TadG